MARIKKAQKGVKASADSSAYYNKQMMDAYESAARNMNFPEYRESAFKRAKQAGKDLDRQAKKGKPGYDKDGFPIKKQRSGGKIAPKKSNVSKKLGSAKKSIGNMRFTKKKK